MKSIRQKEAAAARKNKGGRPSGSRNKRTKEMRDLELAALRLELGQGKTLPAARKLIGSIREVAFGRIVKVVPENGKAYFEEASVRERLQARIWLAERLFGHLPRPLEHGGKGGGPVVVQVEVHPKSPPV